MTPQPRILGIDPSLRATGYAVLERTRNGLRAVNFGVIRNAPDQSHSGCLLAIHRQISDTIRKFEPAAVSIESTIYVQSFKTAIILGAARGCAILAAAEAGIPVHEYAPRKVKQAVVGRGGAAKDQVAFMVRALLSLTETPPPDAADAIAIAMTHFQTAEALARRNQPHPVV